MLYCPQIKAVQPLGANTNPCSTHPVPSTSRYITRSALIGPCMTTAPLRHSARRQQHSYHSATSTTTADRWCLVLSGGQAAVSLLMGASFSSSSLSSSLSSAVKCLYPCSALTKLFFALLYSMRSCWLTDCGIQ